VAAAVKSPQSSAPQADVTRPIAPSHALAPIGLSPPTAQQAAGNLAVQRLFRSGAIQAKLAISQPGDPDELEADRVADQVMRMPEPSGAVPCAACAAGDQPCPKCSGTSRIQRKGSDRGTGMTVSENPLRHLGSGQPLDRSTRSFFEPRFGRDFSDVRVHTDGPAEESARAIQARAFTAGKHLVFGIGQYSPEKHEGRKLLAHELAHVAQRYLGQDAKPIHLRREPDPNVAGMTSGDAPASVVAPPPTPTSPLPPGKHEGAVVGYWGVFDKEPLRAGSRVQRDFGSLEEASAFARGQGRAGAIFEEDQVYILYPVSSSSGFDVGGTRINYSGSISNVRGVGGVLLLITEDGVAIAPKYARTNSGYEPNYGTWMEQQDSPGVTSNPFVGHVEAFGKGLAGITDKEAFLRQFELAMRDTALVMLDNSENEAHAKHRKLRGGIPEADRETVQRVATEVANLDRQITADETTLFMTRASGDRNDSLANRKRRSEGIDSLTKRIEELNAQRKQKLLAYPILSQVDAASFLKLNDEQRATTLGDAATQVQLNIASTRNLLMHRSLNLWMLAPLVASTKQGLGVTAKEQLAWVDEKASSETTWSIALQIALAVLQIGFSVAATMVGGPVGAALAVGALGVGVADAILMTEEYLKKRATSNTDVNRDESLMPADISGEWAWVVVAWVGVGLSFVDAVKAVRVARAAGATDEVLARIARDFKIDEDTLRSAYAKTLLGKAKPDPIALENILRSAMTDEVWAKLGDTPVTVLSDAEFTKLFGTETAEAVTVFNRANSGKLSARVYFRETGNPMVLREEAIHLQQALDPETAAKVQALREVTPDKWRSMSLEGRLSTYKAKIQLEIDAQRRVIALSGDAEYLEDLTEHLKTLEKRLGEIDQLLGDPQRLRSGVHPEWLQPGEFDKATALFAKPRLPRTGGTWIEGRPGNGLWQPDNGTPAYKATGGEPVRFRDNYPVFLRWSEARVSIAGMSGEVDDFAAANRALAKRNGWLKVDGTPNAAEAQRWMDANGLTWHHHQGGVSMLAVPTDLHANIPHTGGASSARAK
jgi:hypothetical protein